MKNFRKIIIIVLLILMLSGCKTSCNVELKKDGKVVEKVETVTNIGKNISKKQLLNYIDIEIKNYKKLLEYGNYKYEIIENKNNIEVSIFKTHSSLCSYFQNTIFNQYKYQHIKCEDDGDYIIIKNDTPIIEDCEYCLDEFNLNDIAFSLKLPVAAIENNADEIKENTYIWYFNKNTEKDKNFYIKISNSDLKKIKEEYKNEQILQKKNNYIKTGIIGLIIIVLITCITCLLFKKYKSNKIEY